MGNHVTCQGCARTLGSNGHPFSHCRIGATLAEREPSVVASTLVDQALTYGGATLQADGSPVAEGYIVATTSGDDLVIGHPGHGSVDLVAAWLRSSAVSGHLQSGGAVGSWHRPDGALVLDRVDVYPTDQGARAVRQGRQNGQDSIYLATRHGGTVIPTDKPGRRTLDALAGPHPS